MMPPYKILLADDHVLVRESIRRTIEDNPGLVVVGEVSNGLELLDFLKKTAVDLVVLDISMPYLHGLEAAKEIKVRHPEVKILVLTMHKSKGHLYQALLAGAEGYLLKENACADLITAINTLRQGQHYVSTLISGHLTDIFRKCHGPEQMPSQEQLTVREQEILSLLSTSKSAKQISDILSISAMTVYNHISNIKKKLNINNNIDLIKYAIEEGYTSIN
jgi:DNA-binding NarL/FixJ family response regulator